MRGKWVDNTSYFGPDRRKARGGLRLSNRRRQDEAGDLPALGALLRRLRVALLGLRTDADREHALRLAAAAIKRAEGLGKLPCADSIKEVARIITGNDAAQFARADTLLIEAMDRAS